MSKVKTNLIGFWVKCSRQVHKFTSRSYREPLIFKFLRILVQETDFRKSVCSNVEKGVFEDNFRALVFLLYFPSLTFKHFFNSRNVTGMKKILMVCFIHYNNLSFFVEYFYMIVSVFWSLIVKFYCFEYSLELLWKKCFTAVSSSPYPHCTYFMWNLFNVYSIQLKYCFSE